MCIICFFLSTEFMLQAKAVSLTGYAYGEFADENTSASAEIYAQVQVVPIPATVWLLISGGIVLMLFTGYA